MNNIIFQFDGASFHKSARLKNYCKNNDLKVIFNAPKNP